MNLDDARNERVSLSWRVSKFSMWSWLVVSNMLKFHDPRNTFLTGGQGAQLPPSWPLDPLASLPSGELT